MLRKFIIDNIIENTFIVVVRLHEIVEIGPDEFKSIMTNDSNPVFISVDKDSINFNSFKRMKANNQVIVLNLEEKFTFRLTDINDNSQIREIKLYEPIVEGMIFTIDYGLTLFFSKTSEDDEDYEYKIECPRCEEMYLEKNQTCGYCNYTRP